MSSIALNLQTPDRFQLRTVVYSHGWYLLPPFEWSQETATLRSVVWIGNAPADVRIQQSGPGMLSATAARKGRWSASRADELTAALEKMLGLNLEFAEFYQLDRERFGWAESIGAGPFLRSGSAFEDAVKMLATTNCSWSLTQLMVTRLVTELGEPTPDGGRAFPTPEVMAAKDAEFYRSTIRAGYRAQAFVELARKVADGDVDPEAWSQPPQAADGEDDSIQLIRRITQLRGFGPYAAENLCKLWGRFGHLAIDSWCMKTFVEIHGESDGDVVKRIRETYAPFGKWQGLALWLDLTKDWHFEP